jgi:hypothetical protein
MLLDREQVGEAVQQHNPQGEAVITLLVVILEGLLVNSQRLKVSIFPSHATHKYYCNLSSLAVNRIENNPKCKLQAIFKEEGRELEFLILG